MVSLFDFVSLCGKGADICRYGNGGIGFPVIVVSRASRQKTGPLYVGAGLLAKNLSAPR
jgi:hypothetical protein